MDRLVGTKQDSLEDWCTFFRRFTKISVLVFCVGCDGDVCPTAACHTFKDDAILTYRTLPQA